MKQPTLFRIYELVHLGNLKILQYFTTACTRIHVNSESDTSNDSVFVI